MNARSTHDRSTEDRISKTTPTPQRRRRWPIVLTMIAGVLLVVVMVIAHFLQPAQLTALVLSCASQMLKLDLRTNGSGSFALRPEPRLVLPGLNASVPDASVPFFRSGQVELALPWSTLRGGDLVITRIVMKSPDLDLPSLQRWLATRPPSTKPFKLPHLTQGMDIEDGLLRGDGWRIEHFNAALPSLADDKPAALDADGNFIHGTSASKFKLTLAATAAGENHGIRIENAHVVLKADGELPSFTATGSLVAADAFSLDLAGTLQNLPAGWAASIDSSYEHADTPFSIALNTAPPTPASASTTALSIALPSLRLRKLALGDPSRQPSLTLTGEAGVETTLAGYTLAIALRGQLSRWPNAWPVLPEPPTSNPATAGSAEPPFTFDASYRGPLDLSAPISYNAKRADTQLHGQLRIADLRNWVAGKIVALIPPIQAQLSTPRIDIGGVQLQGVQVEISDDPATPAAASKPLSASSSVAGKPSGSVRLP